MNQTRTLVILLVVLLGISTAGMGIGVGMGPGMMGPGMMGGYWAGGSGAWWPAMVLGWVGMLGFWAGIVVLGVLLVRWLAGTSPSAGRSGEDDARQTASATTGVGDGASTRRIELPILDLDGPQAATRLREQLGAIDGVRRVVVNAGRRVARVDYDPAAVTIDGIIAHAKRAGYAAGTASAELGVQGIHCASCVVAIEEALGRTRGVLTADVNPATGHARVTYVPGLVDVDGLARAIESAGYAVGPPSAATETALGREDQDRDREYRTLLRKFWFAAMVSVPVVVISYPQFFPVLR